jgi:hypothetical protein
MRRLLVTDTRQEEPREHSSQGGGPGSPEPCGQEAPRSAFSVGLVKMLKGLGAAAALGTAVLLTQSGCGTPPHTTVGDIAVVPVNQPTQKPLTTSGGLLALPLAPSCNGQADGNLVQNDPEVRLVP